MTSAQQETERFSPTDLWWLASGVLAAVSIGIATFAHGKSGQHAGWIVYFGSWAPVILGTLWCLAVKKTSKLTGARQALVAIGIATVNLVLFHRDSFPF
ncbi:hypothetical protein [Streptomyces olivochromogenes]|uniref:Uncharacterized protein n=1 Tax=Streptomyces olivochromogenes TaxID=1963 RepID=A0A250VR17_STROL|nr:hypothetical protein [Streptomyces olivochromogenes]KUN39423.1 hypothetical protein AQJ27_42930 [Streptomyces olivochromogenes]GAX56420.1 hypothetical protein SO3561_07987 [Streptomyces olivochromogenes]